MDPVFAVDLDDLADLVETEGPVWSEDLGVVVDLRVWVDLAWQADLGAEVDLAGMAGPLFGVEGPV